MPDFNHAQAYLNSVEEKTNLNQFECDAVQKLIEQPGMALLLGLLVTTRQGMLMQLANMNLYSEAGRYQAAVLQGRVQGIDLFHQTLLEQFPMAESPERK